VNKHLPERSATYIKNSDHFRERLKSLRLPPNVDEVFIGTADVTAMYNNIPTHEGIAAVAKKYEQDRTFNTIIPTKSLVLLLQLVLTNNYFEFNNKYYLQLTGTSMGTRCAPAYACLFMSELEERFFSQCSSLPFFICRYMDDYFFVWIGAETGLVEFLTNFNSFHPSIKLTYSYSRTTANFLDISVNLVDGKFNTSMFHKPTDSPQYLHFTSAHPAHTKRSVPYSLALRSVRAHTCKDEAAKDLERLEKHFISRGYPRSLVKKCN
jgi:hypothetical protein